MGVGSVPNAGNGRIFAVFLAFALIYLVAMIGPTRPLAGLASTEVYVSALLVLCFVSLLFGGMGYTVPRRSAEIMLLGLAIGIAILYPALNEMATAGSMTGLSTTIIYFTLMAVVASLARVCNWNARSYTTAVSWVFLCVAFIHAGIGLSAYYGMGFPDVQTGSIRLSGWTGGPKYMAGVAVCGMISGLSLLKFRARGAGVNLLIAGGLVVVLVALLHSGTRSGVVSVIVAAMVLLALSPATLLRRLVHLAAGLVACGGIVAVLVWMATQGLTGGRAGTLDTGRADIWRWGWQTLESADLRQLLFGHGNGYFTREHRGAHSTYLRFFVDYGVVAVSIIGFYLIYVTMAATRVLPPAERVTYLSGMTAVLVFGIANQGLFIGPNPEYWYFMLLLGVLLCRTEEEYTPRFAKPGTVTRMEC